MQEFLKFHKKKTFPSNVTLIPYNGVVGYKKKIMPGMPKANKRTKKRTKKKKIKRI